MGNWEMKKTLSLWNFFTIGFGAMIGTGWILLVGDWIVLGGGPIVAMTAYLICAGPDVRYAFNTAEEIEFVCELYCRARIIGDPILLSKADMDIVLEKFKTYGQRD